MAKDTTIRGVIRRDSIVPAPSEALLQYMERKYPMKRLLEDDIGPRSLERAIGHQQVIRDLRRLLEAEEEAKRVPT